MDIVRVGRRPKTARLATRIAAVAIVIAAAAWTLPSLLTHRASNEPAVARDGLVIDTVRRGTLERSVTAAGILVPDRVHVVASLTDGIVTELPVRAGAHVSAGSIVARMDNPDLGVAVADAAAQLVAAQADVRSAREESAASLLDEDAVLRSARAENARALVEATANTDLHAQGLIGDLQYRSALIKIGEDRDLVAIARSKISVGSATAEAKIAAAQARVDQLAAELAARRAKLATLVVRAGANGVVQSIAIDAGQRVTSGTEFARIAADRDLKAVLQVAESDVRGIGPGLRTRVTTSDAGVADGRVTRIAPAAQNGTVAVDVALDRLPPGARADQNVDGTIVIRRAPNALSIARPATASDGTHIVLYRLDHDGTRAYRTRVALGNGSDERVEILWGLRAADRVIVSDTSAFEAPILRIAQ